MADTGVAPPRSRLALSAAGKGLHSGVTWFPAHTLDESITLRVRWFVFRDSPAASAAVVESRADIGRAPSRRPARRKEGVKTEPGR